MILVTGATGFLGRNLVPRLLETGRSVRALVRPASDAAFLKQLGVELAYAADISDTEAVISACQGCHQVIHAAGHFRFWGETAVFHQTNVMGTKAVLDAALAANVKRFIHISTIVVVGDNPANAVIDETTLCHPQEPYQRAKLEGEQLALTYAQERGLPVVVLRPGAFYGPWGRYAFNRLFFEEPLRGWRIKVDGGRRITFPIFAPDLVQAILSSLIRGRSGQIYHICSQSLSHNEVNAVISELTGISKWRANIPTWMVLTLARTWTAVSRITRREPFYPINMAPYVFQDWRVNTAKAQKELDFAPTPFAVGAQKTLEWYWRQGILKRKT
ncbi:MAG: NAD-dependent epimerase/dehydratase family protein [Chloroflexi bacterium]|nr:NAD-dependent epimerase/dehydratase family protein [Chloroflexota bacterium]